MRRKTHGGSLVLGCPNCEFEAAEERFPHLLAAQFPWDSFEVEWIPLDRVCCPGCGAIYDEGDLEEILE